MRTQLRITNTILLVGAEVATLVALVRIGDHPPFELGAPVDAGRITAWRQAEPLDALAAAMRVVALVFVAWLLLVTVWSVVAACTDRAPRRSHSNRGPLRELHDWIEQVVVTSVIAGSLLAPTAAHTATAPPVVTIVRDGHTGSLDALPADPHSPTPTSSAPPTAPTTSTTTSRAIATASAPTVTPPPASVPTPVETREVVVERGDSLWELAAREVARVRGVDRRGLADTDVVGYWSLVCERNRDRLVSGDVNLIHPGEVIRLPDRV